MSKKLCSSNLFISIFLLVASLVSFELLPSTAHAASPNDSNYQRTPALAIGIHGAYGVTTSDTDLSLNWQHYILDTSTWYNSTTNGDANISLQNAFSNGRWGVSISDSWDGGGYDNIVNAFWTEDNSLALDWTSIPGVVCATGNNLKSIYIAPRAWAYGGGSSTPIAWSYSTTGRVCISNNRPFVQNPTNSSQSYSIANLALHVSNLNYPNGYAGEQIPNSSPPRNYVSLGDSFSSGEGNPPFDSTTDIAGTNECHRSSAAYPNILASILYLNLTSSIACSGATTNNLTTTGQWNENLQDEAATETADTITLGIGGDDIGFKDYATACVQGYCGFNTQIYTTTHNKIVYDLPSKLLDAFIDLNIRTSSSAKIYVVGYPNLLPSPMPTDTDCYPFNGGDNNPDPGLNNGAAARTIETDLNNTIAQAVTNYDSEYSTTKFQYVDVNNINSPFLGHDLCSNNSYFYDENLLNPVYSFHPNINGQKAYAQVLQLAIN